MQYQSLVLDLANINLTLSIYARAVPEWRKPLPGMLLAAGHHFNLGPEEILFIGDYDTDAEAAASAKIQFQWADDFFNN